MNNHNHYNNAYARLQYYTLWLKNDIEYLSLTEEFDHGVSIRFLNSGGEIPLHVIRNDFLELFRWQANLTSRVNSYVVPFVTVDTESDAYRLFDSKGTFADLLDNLYETRKLPSSFEEQLLAGTLDDIPMFLDSTLSPGFSLKLTPEEATALHQSFRFHQESRLSDANYFKGDYLVSPHHNMQSAPTKNLPGESYHYDGDFLIKDNYQYNHAYEAIDSKLKAVNDSIISHKMLRIRYHGPFGTDFHDIIPLKIAYDASDNTYSIWAKEDNKLNTFRLDRITKTELLKQKHSLSDADMELPYAPQIWGNDLIGVPTHVKVLFRNEGNVIRKVKKDLAFRTLATITKTADGLLFEDNVYGLDKFRSWLRGYGSSAIVLEPESLRQTIVTSLLKAKANYENG